MYDRIDGGRLCARALAKHGTSQIFGLQGGHIDPILYGCVNEGIKIFDTRHEQGAALMAEAWGLATGQTGVCCVTAGPGLTNAITGIANAYMNGSPLICLAGRRPSSQADRWTLQDLDQVRLIEPISRWARSIGDGARIGEYVRMAYAHSRSGSPGPVYLDFPADLLASPVSQTLLESTGLPVRADFPSPSAEIVDRVGALLEASERPIIVAGSGVHWSGAGSSLSELASRLGIPVFTINAGRGAVSDEDEWCMGAAQPVGGSFLMAASQADVVLCIGVRLGYLFLNGLVFGGAKLIRVDVERSELANGSPAEIEVLADAHSFCIALVQASKASINDSRRQWRDRIYSAGLEARELFDSQDIGPSGGIHPAAAVRSIVEVAGGNASYVSDGGDAMTFGLARFPANRPGQLLATSIYFGALGVGIPYAIAAKLAFPKEPCILWEGDGAFGFNAFEFDTAIRHNVPFVCVVANNGTWGMSWHGQGLQYGYDQLVATELGDRPYHEIVKAMGGYGERVDSIENLRPALDRALSSGKPACVNLQIDRESVSFATQAMASVGLS